MKRLIPVLLCLALCLALCVTAFSEDAEISVLDAEELEGMMADFIAEHNITGGNISIGFIYTGTGEQWDDGNDQVGNGGIFSDSSHNFGIGSGKEGGNKICHHIVGTAGLKQTEDCPGQSTA